MNIEVYTQQQCPPCEYIKNYLKSKNITFIEKDIKHHAYKIELIDMNIMSTPLIIIDGDLYQMKDISEIEQRIEAASC